MFLMLFWLLAPVTICTCLMVATEGCGGGDDLIGLAYDLLYK